MSDSFSAFTQLVLAVALCMPRILAAFTVVPFLSQGYVTGVTRNCIAVSFSLILFPIIFPVVREKNISALVFLAIIAKESVIGAALGYMVGLLFWGIQAVGKIIDYQRGAHVAEAYDPSFGGEMSPIGNLLMPLFIMIFFSSGGFIVFLSAIYESFQAWPIFSYLPVPSSKVAIFSLNKIDDFMEMVLLLTAPLIILMFISDIGMGIINRFAPQLNILFLSMPIKSVLGILLLILYLPYFLFYLKNYIVQNANVLNILKIVMK